MALVVFTGGARSGKSSAATRLAQSRAMHGQDVVVAVFGREDPADPEFAERIRKHREDRPAGWTTLEVADASSWLTDVPVDAVLLVDCIGTLLGLIMEEAYAEVVGTDGDMADAPADRLPPGFERAVSTRFERMVETIAAREGDTIIVTNETGAGVVPQYESARLFRDLLGRSNAYLAGVADAAYLAVCGRLVPLDEFATEVSWPED